MQLGRVHGLKLMKTQANRVCVYRRGPGLGDAIMLRYIFRNIKIKYDPCILTVACMPEYYDAYADHPCVDNVMDQRKAKRLKKIFTHFFDVSRACNEAENDVNQPLHRSEIWGAVCGVDAGDSAEITLDEIALGNARMEQPERPWCLFSPFANMEFRSLPEAQIDQWYAYLDQNYHVDMLCNEAVMDYETLVADDIRELFALIACADLVVSVDTSIFHIATALNKQTIGLFGPTPFATYAKKSDPLGTKCYQGVCPIGPPCIKGWKCPVTKWRTKPCMEISPPKA